MEGAQEIVQEVQENSQEIGADKEKEPVQEGIRILCPQVSCNRTLPKLHIVKEAGDPRRLLMPSNAVQ